MRLIILHHDCADLRDQNRHYIHALIPHWERRGIEVRHAVGTRDLPQGDAALLHVDLSVVPDRFLDAARSYPLALNVKISDIRKRSLPDRDHLVSAPPEHAGAVVVKTNLNHGGRPERDCFKRHVSGLPFREKWVLFRANRLPKTISYGVYESPDLVPKTIWKDRRYVVEKFLPEMENDRYVLRYAYFLGNAHVEFKMIGEHQIVRWQKKQHEEMAPISPEILAYREKIGLDYGKIDYVLHAGKPLILDVNKTVGGPSMALVETPLARILAGGLACF